MIATLESAVRVGERHGAIPQMTNWLRGAADGLRQRWPDADRVFPDAYTTRE
jgi:hypothetical protein